MYYSTCCSNQMLFRKFLYDTIWVLHQLLQSNSATTLAFQLSLLNKVENSRTYNIIPLYIPYIHVYYLLSVMIKMHWLEITLLSVKKGGVSPSYIYWPRSKTESIIALDFENTSKMEGPPVLSAAPAASTQIPGAETKTADLCVFPVISET